MNLPVLKTDDPLSVIKGLIPKFDKTHDPMWYLREGLPLPPKALVLATGEVAQQWDRDNNLVDAILARPGEPLPDVEALNEAIPRSEWRDFNGQPQGPWQHSRIVYLLDPHLAGLYTFISATIGARIAWSRLRERTSGCGHCAASRRCPWSSSTACR
jgi:hypothetical protein